jgi:alkanesulfonate monooxygenase SsuD/methylene tetrahydromethanopterin reductase-like flavin-dependent oxidoreductase (luciferase family)
VIVGLGSGWFASEYEAYGAPFPPVGERLRALDETCEIMKRLWTEEQATFAGAHARVEQAWCEPKPVRRPPILIGGGGEQKLLRIAAKHADIWNNLAVNQAKLGAKADVLQRRCEEIGRDPAEVEISQQCLVVIAADEAAAREALAKANKIYGGHMGAGLEEHGIWGSPEQVIERIERHRKLGCSLFVIEFFGRDTRVPARLFAEKVMPAF